MKSRMLGVTLKLGVAAAALAGFGCLTTDTGGGSSAGTRDVFRTKTYTQWMSGGDLAYILDTSQRRKRQGTFDTVLVAVAVEGKAGASPGQDLYRGKMRWMRHEDFVQKWGLTADEFDQEAGSLKRRGYRLIQQQRFTNASGQTLYQGVWEGR